MTIGAILLAVAIFVLVAVFTLQPFFTQTDAISLEGDSYERLLTRKSELMADIEELELDFSAEKVDEATFNQQREQLVWRAAALLQQMDGLGRGKTLDLDVEIERAVAQLHRDPCRNCGHVLRVSDNFCPECGEKQ